MENNMGNQQGTVEKQEEDENNSINSSNNRVLYGGFWARLAAYFIDGFIVNIASFVIAIPFSLLSGFYTVAYGNEFSEVFFNAVGSIIGFGMGFGYYIYMTYKYQATLGKMAIGIRVLNEQGKKPTLGEVAMREVLGKIVSSLTLGIGYLIAAFTDRKQALHDMIGKTIVVAKDQENGINKTVVIVINICCIGFLVLLMAFFGFLIVAFVAAEGGAF